MDGIHDMGGMHGFGKVEPEQNEPVFHAAWEGRCLALNRAMGAIGAWTIDEGRAGIEALPPDVYLASSYYGKWALRLQNMVVARGLAGADELAAGHALHQAKPLSRKLDGRRRATHADPRLFRPARSGARALCGWRPCAREKHPPADAYAAAALRARPCRHRSKPFAAAMFSRTRRRSAAARIRNGSTPCVRRAASCLARRPIRR